MPERRLHATTPDFLLFSERIYIPGVGSVDRGPPRSYVYDDCGTKIYPMWTASRQDPRRQHWFLPGGRLPPFMEKVDYPNYSLRRHMKVKEDDTFTADQFTGTEHSPAEEKAWFANHFVMFVKSGFEEKYFTKKFYQRLSMTFGHIAHYSKDGFWDYFFDKDVDRNRFLQECMRYPCYGEPAYTYCDVEKALQEWMRGTDIMESWQKKAEESLQQGELNLYLHLKEKYGDLEDS